MYLNFYYANAYLQKLKPSCNANFGSAPYIYSHISLLFIDGRSADTASNLVLIYVLVLSTYWLT